MTDLRKAAEIALEALELARSSHGVLLLSDPPQDPWKTRKVDDAIYHATIALRAAILEYDEFLLEIHEEFGVK